MNRIIFINQDSGYLMIDIINSYVNAGYDCVLITGRLVERNIPLNKSVRIEHIIRYNRTSAIRRLFTWSIGFLQIFFRVVCRFRKDELFIVTNPPLAPLLPLIVQNRFRLLVFDVYPDVLSELGYISGNSVILKCWSWANRKVYTRAGRIFTITDSMKNVIQKYTNKGNIEIVPVWTDNTFLRPIDPEENRFLKAHNLSGKFIVLYSGNLGLSGDVDALVEIAANIVRDDIIFCIVGDGAKKQLIRTKTDKLGLKNLILLPWQPTSELPYSLASASLAVISLAKNASKLAIPSKLYNFLSVGAPLLCITEKESEVEILVEKFSCGKCFDPKNITGMTKYILAIADNTSLREYYRRQSLKASENFGLKNVGRFVEAHAS